MQPVKIVIDSASDLPVAWLQALDIAVIPAFVNFGQESFADDGIALSRAEFYRRLAESSELPHTAAPPSAIIEDVIGAQLAKAERVIVFTLSAKFSSLHNGVRAAAARVDPVRVTVVDSGTVSMGEGWQALAAAEAAARGDSYEQVLRIAESVRERTRLVPVIDTLEYLRRGGRISRVVAGLGGLLQIKPMLDVGGEGQVTVIARTRTMTKAVQGLLDLTRSQGPLERLALLHSDYPEGAALLETALKDILPAGERCLMIGDVATAIGTHVGPGCVGVAWVRQVR
jgi:DegV family protein with EDD domain